MTKTNTNSQQAQAERAKVALRALTAAVSNPDPAQRQKLLDFILDDTVFTDPAVNAEAQRLMGIEPDAIEAETGLPTARADAETVRLAVALKLDTQARLWLICRRIATERHHGDDWLLLNELETFLPDAGIEYHKKHFHALLRAGNDIFWRYRPDSEKLFFIGARKVAVTLAEMAAEADPDLLTNLPGTRDVYLPLSGSIEEFRAMALAGWIASRELTTPIATATLAQLFGRTERTIRRWRKNRLEGALEAIPAYAQATAPEQLPGHEYHYATNDGDVRYRRRLPNAYSSKIEKHAHKGQARKVRAAVQKSNVVQPVIFCADGQSRERLYWTDSKRLQRAIRRYCLMDGRYLQAGFDRNGHLIFDFTQDGHQRTTASERASWREERQVLRGKLPPGMRVVSWN